MTDEEKFLRAEVELYKDLARTYKHSLLDHLNATEKFFASMSELEIDDAIKARTSVIVKNLQDFKFEIMSKEDAL